VKKVLVSLTLGIALLAPGQLARCDQSRPTDDRPRARRARVERPSSVDLARRFAIRGAGGDSPWRLTSRSFRPQHEAPNGADSPASFGAMR